MEFVVLTQQVPTSTGMSRLESLQLDVIDLGALRVQTSHQIAHALASRELGVRDAQKMIPGREMPDAVIRRELIYE